MNTVHDLNNRDIGFKVLTGQGAQIDTTTSQGKLVFGSYECFHARLSLKNTYWALLYAFNMGFIVFDASIKRRC